MNFNLVGVQCERVLYRLLYSLALRRFHFQPLSNHSLLSESPSFHCLVYQMCPTCPLKHAGVLPLIDQSERRIQEGVGGANQESGAGMTKRGVWPERPEHIVECLKMLIDCPLKLSIHVEFLMVTVHVWTFQMAINDITKAIECLIA